MPITREEILAEVIWSLSYAGDSGSGPEPSTLKSGKYQELVAAVMSNLEQHITEAVLLSQFWLESGHPAYPVFWDFAFVIAGPAGGIVFIGSSSD